MKPLRAKIFQSDRRILDTVVENSRLLSIGSAHSLHHTKQMQDIGVAALSRCPRWACAAIWTAVSSAFASFAFIEESIPFFIWSPLDSPQRSGHDDHPLPIDLCQITEKFPSAGSFRSSFQRPASSGTVPMACVSSWEKVSLPIVRSIRITLLVPFERCFQPRVSVPPEAKDSRSSFQ